MEPAFTKTIEEFAAKELATLRERRAELDGRISQLEDVLAFARQEIASAKQRLMEEYAAKDAAILQQQQRRYTGGSLSPAASSLQQSLLDHAKQQQYDAMARQMLQDRTHPGQPLSWDIETQGLERPSEAKRNDVMRRLLKKLDGVLMNLLKKGR